MLDRRGGQSPLPGAGFDGCQGTGKILFHADGNARLYLLYARPLDIERKEETEL